MLCVQDEIGVLLQTITSRKASNHEKAVSQILRTLWGCSFSRVPPAQWATRKMRSLNCPALSIFGASTTEEFHAALQGEQVANGFLNRFLVLNSNVRNREREPERAPYPVPMSLIDCSHPLLFKETLLVRALPSKAVRRGQFRSNILRRSACGQ